ncbi:hypothetical protein MKW92_009806 [Papaver armeniacum]|nr:hypothetical protein MKW92_009806 [Papaver armeniacum]
MPLSKPSIDTSDQGEQQQQSFPVTLPAKAPPLPPGPHPSLLAPGQSYQQFSHHMPPLQQQQHHPYQQQIPSLPVPLSNMLQMQPPPSHLSFPSLSGRFFAHALDGMQGSANQMVQPMPRGHMMGMNQMHSGYVPANAPQQPFMRVGCLIFRGLQVQVDQANCILHLRSIQPRTTCSNVSTSFVPGNTVIVISIATDFVFTFMFLVFSSVRYTVSWRTLGRLYMPNLPL